jgi:hypothetical protein
VLKGLARGARSFYRREPYLRPLQALAEAGANADGATVAVAADLGLGAYLTTLQDVSELSEGLPVRPHALTER